MKIIIGRPIYALLLLFLFAGALYLCKDWGMKARLFPLMIAVGGIGLSIWILRAETTYARSPRKREARTERDKLAAVLKVSKQKATPKSEGIMILWVSAFVSMILVFGFWGSIAVFLPVFMFLFGRENWKTVAIYTPAVWVAIYLIFHIGLRVPLYGGILGLSFF